MNTYKIIKKIKTMSTITFKPSLYDFDKLAEKRISRMELLMNCGEYMGLQISFGTEKQVKCFGFSSFEADLKDLSWVLCGGDAVELIDIESGDNFFEEKNSFYMITHLFDNKEDGFTDPIFQPENREVEEDLWNLLAEAEAKVRIYIAKGNNNELCGAIIVSLPQMASFRLRASARAAFTEATYCSIRNNDFLIPSLNRNDRLWISKVTVKATNMTLSVESKKKSREYCELADSIEELNLSVRAYNCLKRAGILTIKQLRAMKDEDLRNVRNLGQRSYEHVKNCLAEYDKKDHRDLSDDWEDVFDLSEDWDDPFDLPKDSAEIEHVVQVRDYLDELNRMVGLEEAKKQVKRIMAFARMNRDMKNRGKKTMPVSFHMAFYGNPGTGKTTVARLTAGIFHEMGLLSSSEIVEVGRSELIGKYTGQTAPLVKEVFRKAKGKVLFIDEAYSLLDRYEGSYGDEAINAIVQEMENNRKETVVIFAGYPDKMQEFLRRNPGLASRVPFEIEFADYSAEEMLQMIHMEAEKRGFSIQPEADERILEICQEAVKCNDAGNGRFARNQIEDAILSYADREYSLEAPSDSEKTFMLLAEDFKIPEMLKDRKLKNLIGFRAS